MERTDQIYWHAHVQLDKYEGDWTAEQIDAGEADGALVETLERDGNLLLIGGASALWERLIGTSITAYSNANARIGIGDSTTAAADTQTDLQAATNKTYKAMDATYPQHTDSTGTAGSKSIVLRSTFGTTDANYVWNEWIIDNGTRALNRKVENLGTKTSAGTWVLTITLSLA